MIKKVAGFVSLVLLSVFIAQTAMANAVGKRIGSGPSVSDSFIGSGIHVMHTSRYLSDGSLELGGLVIKEEKGQKEIMVEVVRFDSSGNGKQEFITVSELSQITSGRSALKYGISTNNKLILFKSDNKHIKIAQDASGNYDIEDRNTKMQEIDNGGYFLVTGSKMPDGRIKIGRNIIGREKAGAKSSQALEGKPLPPFKVELKGQNEVRIKNPNVFTVTVGLRSGNQGKDFEVTANGISSVYVPNGGYKIYFIYSNKSGALFQGDDFYLDNHGIEIKIVKVVGGNYGIKQVK